MMLLPLRDAHGNATRILGVLETRGQIGRGPPASPSATSRPRR
ncbi:MAG: hypothetical protein R3D59_18530 [Paracoccaceae bacterium]